MQSIQANSDPKWDFVVIGAGNAGLTCAATLARAGKRTLLLERHNIPGGCGTSFTRGRFEFEVALHQLSGVGTVEAPGPLCAMFDDLGVTKDLEFVRDQNLYRVFIPGEIDCTLPVDRAAFAKVLKEQFPQQREAIDRFDDLVYRVAPQYLGSRELLETEQTIEEAREKFPDYFRYALKSAKEVLDEFFDDEKIRHVLAAYWGYMGSPPCEMKFMELALLLWAYRVFTPAHVVGGSQSMSTAIVESFRDAGGISRLNCGVKRILIEDGLAVGVETEHGERIFAETVVSNVSPIVTYSQMMDPVDVPESAYKDMASRQIGVSGFVLHVGLDCVPEDLGIEVSATFLGTDVDHDLAVQKMRSFEPPGYALLTCYDCENSNFSPKGASHVALMTLQYGEHWIGLDPEEYISTKYAYADHLIEMAEACYPGFRSKIEEVDVATPLTHMRYLGHPGGAIYGFEQDIMDTNILHPKPRMPPIPNVHLTGTWVGSGGFQPTLLAGATLAKHLISTSNEERE